MPAEKHLSNIEDINDDPTSVFLNDQTNTFEKIRLKREREKAVIEVAAAESRAHRSEIKNLNLERDIKGLQELCSNQKGLLLANKVKEYEKRASQYEKEKSEYEENIREYKREKDEYEETVNQYKEERDGYKEEASQYKKERDEAKDELEKLDSEREAEELKLKTKITNLKSRRFEAFERQGSTLVQGECLSPGGSLSSPDGSVTLNMQTDGKIAVYWGGQCRYQNTREQRNDIKGIYMENGALVMYNTDYLSADRVTWRTDDPGLGYNQTAICTVQDDGNVAIYYTVLCKGARIWSSNSKKP
ncbi:hypothetical protein ABW20_dc0107036 [Dactylellina cionopaga]|nr:hypothetical protein ABW20_dc0107036 [Dactylellina cionopaga]